MSNILDDSHLRKKRNNGALASIGQWLNRLDMGSMPIVLGMLIIWIIFQSANDKFLTPLNLTNLVFQISALGTISVGTVLVLLLGEVDLSAGVVSGLSAAVMAVLNVKQGVPGPLAVMAGLLTGVLIGIFHGFGSHVLEFRLSSSPSPGKSVGPVCCCRCWATRVPSI